MTLTMTHEQSAALHGAPAPLRMVDPQTNQTYVLVPEDALASIQALFADGPLSAEERSRVLRGVWARADWDDPAMDEYAALVRRKDSP